MIEPLQRSLIAQFAASLSMLEACVAHCPDSEWERPIGNSPFWQVAYHVLFYIDLYLSPSEDDFEPQDFLRKNYESLGPTALPPHEEVVADLPYTRETISGYVVHCRRKAAEVIAAETPDSFVGPSGFSWYSIPRIEFYVNNIRHAQHHTAQLSLHLRRAAGIEIEWVGSE